MNRYIYKNKCKIYIYTQDKYIYIYVPCLPIIWKTISPAFHEKKQISGCSVAFDGLGGFATGWVPKIHCLEEPGSQDEWLVSDPDHPLSENSGFSPQIINFNRVFHYFHHPFWGETPLFLETPIETSHGSHTPRKKMTNGFWNTIFLEVWKMIIFLSFYGWFIGSSR